MPLTAPAHQAFVLPIKLVWPSRTDATALCIGAAAPDLGYPMFGVDSHSPIGVALFAVPITLLAAWVLRHGAALGVFAQVPDAGPLRLHSYRALVHRRPGWAITLTCAVIGAASHVLVDAFTHPGRSGSELLGTDGVLFTVPLLGGFAGARVMQYCGHLLGSAASLAMFWHIGRARLMEHWYGPEVVADARRFRVSLRERVQFLWVVAIATSATVVVTLPGGRSPVFAVLLGATIGALVAGWWTARNQPHP